MYEITHTPFMFHNFSTAVFVARLLSHIIRNDEICVGVHNGDVLRSYRCGFLYFNAEDE